MRLYYYAKARKLQRLKANCKSPYHGHHLFPSIHGDGDNVGWQKVMKTLEHQQARGFCHVMDL